MSLNVCLLDRVTTRTFASRIERVMDNKKVEIHVQSMKPLE